MPDLGSWSRRVPSALISLLVGVPLVVMAIAEMSAEQPCTPVEPCRGVLRSSEYWLDAPAVFTALALVVVAFVVPRVAVWAAVVVALAFSVPGGAVTSFPSCWMGLAVLWAVLAGSDVAGRARQQRVAAGWSRPSGRPPLPSRPLRWDEDTRPLAWTVAIVLLGVAGGLLVQHGKALEELERFEASAVVTTGTVLDPGLEGPMTIEVTGRPYVVEFPLEYHTAGDELPVLVDAAGGRAELVAEPADPSWLLGLAVLAALLATTVWVPLWSRGRRRSDLLRRGGPAVELRLREGRYHTLDDERPSRWWSHELVVGDLWPAESALVDERVAGDDPEPSWGEDEGLDDAVQEAPPGPRRVTVIGTLADGYPVLVQDGDHLVLTSRPVRDPWLLRRLPRLLRGSSTARW